MKIGTQRSINLYEKRDSARDMATILPKFSHIRVLNGECQISVKKFVLPDTYSEPESSSFEDVFAPSGNYLVKPPLAPPAAHLDKVSSCIALTSVVLLILSVVVALPAPLSLVASLALTGPLLISLIALVKG